MKKPVLFFLFLVTSYSGFSLNSPELKSYKYTFSKKENFKVSFADYPKGEEKFFELQFKNDAKLPYEINTSLHALKISGNNHSDDLFMYAYKKVKDLKPNTTYRVSFSLEFASNAPDGSTGVGGSPGDSVYVKIGAVSHKPLRYVDDLNHYRINLDKGNQALDGKDMLTIGSFGVDTANSVYRLKTLPYLPTEEIQTKLANYTTRTNDKGEVWLVLGTDSGFESTTTIFYTSLSVTFKELIEESK
ncbi:MULTISPECIES: hypothetical protein [Legionella]|uniref:Uncharacterized protein n=1 Tax=Legionella resiliens TaxID=2905958 RepID=A0ABS8X4J6_9GAMM|nr:MULTISPECIES: hypothetical protein [unclassified Legionella]MCE0723287.1 hypothetical protein [Legionella sp. 9fVS26]MCE3532440.1 hypothetical protein [Legionella sp. 8cVS16]QLZ68580.1 hypothetical protein FOLKNPGA_01359 [Legionella sp. PC1000]